MWMSVGQLFCSGVIGTIKLGGQEGLEMMDISSPSTLNHFGINLTLSF
jgi:hypothetical protein